ncbi:MAG TPA: ABC transporter ATP-binding protein [Acidobacteriota bacterium]|nr:ABC transporter ATP-binding protein [Acidobacteriota bacterium]
MALPILDVRHLSVSYPTPSGQLRAVSDLSLQISPGETVALVGETGCGKSTLALTLLGLLGSGQIESGEILFNDLDLRKLKKRDWRKIRGGQIGLIFQDARSALNPTLTVGAHLVEAMRAHQSLSRKQARARSLEILSEAGIPEPHFQMRRYPFELSGGMCQRVCIALGICNNPRLLVADEPTSALDPTIQAQIIDLLERMKHRHSLSLLLISHDLALVSESAQRIAVMYHSRLVEFGPRGSVLTNPLHPYTRALKEAVPDLDHHRDSRPLAAVPGATPAPGEDFPGCPFVPRCRFSEPRCSQAFPEPSRVTDGHWAACISEIR